MGLSWISAGIGDTFFNYYGEDSLVVFSSVMVISMLPDQSLSRSSADKVSTITWVSISLGLAGMSAGFGVISFNLEGGDILIVVPLGGGVALLPG